MAKSKPNPASNPARATKLDMNRPLYSVPPSDPHRARSKQSAQSKVELAALREEVKRAASTEGGRQGEAAKLALGQIEAKFGNDEYRKAIREFKLTYKGVQNPPINVLPGMGPVQ